VAWAEKQAAGDEERVSAGSQPMFMKSAGAPIAFQGAETLLPDGDRLGADGDAQADSVDTADSALAEVLRAEMEAQEFGISPEKLNAERLVEQRNGRGGGGVLMGIFAPLLGDDVEEGRLPKKPSADGVVFSSRTISK